MIARPTSTQRGYGFRWQKLRADYLRRHPLCRSCEAKGRIKPANEVDHIQPRSRGGQDAEENLQPLCKPCHSRKTGRETQGTDQGGFDGNGEPLDKRHIWLT